MEVVPTYFLLNYFPFLPAVMQGIFEFTQAKENKPELLPMVFLDYTWLASES